jgi:hypothetical protein
MHQAPINLVEHDQFIEVVVSSMATVDECNAAIDAVIERHGLDCLRIWSLPPDLRLDGPKLADIARHSVSIGVRGRVAIVAPSDLAYGLARVHVAHRDASESLGLFRSRDAALSWLLEEPGASA